jgi:hypothetical protein
MRWILGTRFFLLAVLALGPALAGCALQKHQRAVAPFTLRHCRVTTELPGFIGCDCAKPLVVWDARLRRKVYYCDGKAHL